eukprot:4444271-Pyramimonas_sp.AAC.1
MSAEVSAELADRNAALGSVVLPPLAVEEQSRPVRVYKSADLAALKAWIRRSDWNWIDACTPN